MTVVTLGAYSVPSLRAFYRAIGWRENEGSDDGYTSFTLGSVRLALYPIDQLRNEASPGEAVAARETWNRVTLAVNVATRDEVDVGFAAAVEAGARPIESPVEREWGGYSGYFADPEGHRWELAWAPFFTDFG
jgi:hypothetical protein